MDSSQESVSPDTQAALLLCGTLSKGHGELKPLTLSEYNAVVSHFHRLGKRPADLLESPSLPLDEPGLPDPDRMRTLLARGVEMATALERWQRLGLWIIGQSDVGYPDRLRNLRSAAPALLYGVGDIARLAMGGLAIVGSRDIDEEGLSFTRDVGMRCASENLQVISGGARGVDQAAVAAALEADGGAVVVLADGLDRAATARDAKGPIRRGLLTIVTPFDPESGFSVGKAMGRNKQIYALADFALVVRFTAGEGGTWGGAIEQLDRNRTGPGRVPVFVRVVDNPQEGWLDLESQGALAFPEAEFREGKLTESLSRAVPANETVDDAYGRFLSHLLEQLPHEPSEKELAERLKVRLKQLREWLKRAIAEGKATKAKKKGRVVYTAATPLFDGADEEPT